MGCCAFRGAGAVAVVEIPAWYGLPLIYPPTRTCRRWPAHFQAEKVVCVGWSVRPGFTDVFGTYSNRRTALYLLISSAILYLLPYSSRTFCLADHTDSCVESGPRKCVAVHFEVLGWSASS